VILSVQNNEQYKEFWRENKSKTKHKDIWSDNDLENAFNAARKLFQDKLPQFETFYDYKKSLVKK
jgi:hypothetical protein